MFVGQSGVGRIVEQTCTEMQKNNLEDPYDIERVRTMGVIDLPAVQRKLNFHFAVSLDLFGSEISTNAAGFFDTGIKGRYRETHIEDDHLLVDATYPVLKLDQGRIKLIHTSALPALNMRLRDDYVRECARGVERWNNIISRTNIPFTLTLPHTAFSRAIGEFASINTDPEGRILNNTEWEAQKHQFLPTAEDKAYLDSIMVAVTAPGEFASWIAPPSRSIDGKPRDFEYAKIAG